MVRTCSRWRRRKARFSVHTEEGLNGSRDKGKARSCCIVRDRGSLEQTRLGIPFR